MSDPVKPHRGDLLSIMACKKRCEHCAGKDGVWHYKPKQFFHARVAKPISQYTRDEANHSTEQRVDGFIATVGVTGLHEYQALLQAPMLLSIFVRSRH
jgi:hypothetical protein